MINYPVGDQSSASYAALPAAVSWIEEMLTGNLGTSVAVLAVAWVAVMLLQGRMPVRYGARIVLGCFILFGAPVIAAGLMDAVRGSQQVMLPQPAAPLPPLIPVPSKAPQFDPYAGASVPHQ